jgi:hypothetical protein
MCTTKPLHIKQNEMRSVESMHLFVEYVADNKDKNNLWQQI